MAYMEKGKVISCVIDLPELNTQIKSIDGIGTFCNNQKIEPKPNNIEHSYWIVEGHSKKWKMATELSKDVMAVRSFGCTSVTLGLVAKGEVCCIINTWNNAWDIYPGITACKNAGMVVIEEDKNIIIAPSNELAEYGLKITKTVK
ncbi:MAG: hypothetical protein IJZ26_02660 [Clostridia bacterium]|nr:hypothetical protein [Clostridia bacterium]